ncbi:nitrogen fixation protein NifQ [Oryzibacter oryziterrae]|uniref:nitrogen fixation protein NifQ n=1 Tax=Oryzibacter oryziterrae TaxID=2766474 RepID=UPI001F30CC34|nr:nitrogen fixation protein NifQ [Oryzibacter oryziterrae]
MPTTFASHYASLRAAQWPTRTEADAFDNHVLASALAAALTEVDRGEGSLADGLGLKPGEIGRLLDRRFPILRRAALELEWMAESPADDEELMLRELLMAHRSGREPLSSWLAVIIARRAMRADHLWQDLGLGSRDELNRLLKTHFSVLHAGNTRNMRWKKYFYRVLCEEEGFSLCTAPSCSVCTDFQSCFGEEDGMSRMAELRRQLTVAA